MIELLTEHKAVLKQFTLAGVVSPNWLRNLQIYEDYQALKIDCKMCKYEILADKYKIDSDTIRRVLRELK